MKNLKLFQVSESNGGHTDCPFCDICLKNSIKQIRRRSQRLKRGSAIKADERDNHNQSFQSNNNSIQGNLSK